MSDTTAPDFVDIYAAPADQPPIARKLLEAAGDNPDVVRTIGDGFRVPAEIAAAAGYGPSDEAAVDARARAGAALDGTVVSPDAPQADSDLIDREHRSPLSLPAKVDGGPDHLTDQFPGGPADTSDRPVEVRAAAENTTVEDAGEGVKPAAARTRKPAAGLK
jgi:hypothetical protein